ncbi:hypothetical protein CY35_04G084200 [Sphagnum magellanicum]|nr:hypothetical protein CY35_04G084200 [Sphagnum magellanicum]
MGLRCLVVFTLSMVSSPADSIFTGFWSDFSVLQRYMQQHEEVELSALGMAIATVVTVAEILKNNGLAVEKRILTSTVDMRDEARGRPIQKAKVEIILVKSGQFDELMAAAAEEREVAPEVEDQS